MPVDGRTDYSGMEYSVVGFVVILIGGEYVQMILYASVFVFSFLESRMHNKIFPVIWVMWRLRHWMCSRPRMSLWMCLLDR